MPFCGGVYKSPMSPRKKVKMLISTDCFLPRWDGVSRFLAEIIPSLSNEYDLTVICPNFGPPPTVSARLVRFPVFRWRVGDIHLAKIDSKQIKRMVGESDVIFNQTLGPIGISVLSYAHRLNKPVICFIHSIDWELFSRGVRFGRNVVWHLTRWYEAMLYNRSDMLLVPSREVKEIFEMANIKTGSSVVPLGVNIAQFCPSLSKEKAKREIGVNPKRLVVGFSGRIAREKDLFTLKEAFDIVLEKHPHVQLLIVGKGLPLEEKRLAGRNVIMAGMINNVSPYLQAMDIFVLPSLTETSSLATMEAMACGVPVISTPVGRIKEYLFPGFNGYFFPQGNVNALAKQIAFLIENRELREQMGLSARQTAMKKFRWFETTREIKKAVAYVLRRKEGKNK